MSDPRRLREDPLLSPVLASADADGPAADGRRRAALALGIAPIVPLSFVELSEIGSAGSSTPAASVASSATIAGNTGAASSAGGAAVAATGATGLALGALPWAKLAVVAALAGSAATAAITWIAPSFSAESMAPQPRPTFDPQPATPIHQPEPKREAETGTERGTEAETGTEAEIPIEPGRQRHVPRVRVSARAPDLALEIALIDQAKAALESCDATRAQAILAKYGKIPGRSLALEPEATALAIEAHVLTGDREAAETLARPFLVDQAGAPLADRVERSLGPGVHHCSQQGAPRAPWESTVF